LRTDRGDLHGERSRRETTIDAVTSCATTLTSCAASAAGVGTTPNPQTCQQKFTACLAANPLNFLGCGAALAVCK
jgi:hypothetical protein